MSTIITLSEAQNTLADLVHRLNPGDVVTITEDDQPVAHIVSPTTTTRKIPRLGTLRGTVLSMEHFDDPLEDFKEYTE